MTVPDHFSWTEHDDSRRVWRYPYSRWQPRWWYYLLPYRGSDEYGRLTLVFNVPPIGFVVWAYRWCRHRHVNSFWICDRCGSRPVIHNPGGAP